MYELRVYLPGKAEPERVLQTGFAVDALRSISELLKAHEGCDRVVVYLNGSRPFAVDCEFNPLERHRADTARPASHS